MAKTPVRSHTNSKIRFILLEADLADGDLSQITHAITSALARANGAGPRQLSGGVASASEPSRVLLDANGDVGGDDVVDQQAEPESNGDSASTKVRTRKPRTPKVIELELNSGDMPFAKFAQGKAPTTVLSKYLVVAYWFKTYRELDGVTANHVYTCFKKVSWSTGIRDFAQAFRDLGRAGKGSTKDGVFKINQMGEDAVETMGAK